MAVICDYCGCNARLVTGEFVYPHRHDLSNLRIWYCDNPSHETAYVGCHKGTTKPLGRLADYQLRKAKQEAHKHFDPLWRNGGMRRSQAYSWLAKQLGIARKDCHIGMFDVNMCKRVVELCEESFA